MSVLGARTSLLEQVQRLLERTYRMRSGIEDPGSFVIGDRGFREFYAAIPARERPPSAASGDGCGARTLVRESSEGLRMCVYYPDGLIDRLERFPPQRGLGDENVDAFAALVEELDHLLLLAERRRDDRCLTLFELELHANVSKHLVLARFLAAGRSRLLHGERLWLRHHLFGKVRFCDDDPSVRLRYRDARRWAVRFLDVLPTIGLPERIRNLRRFHETDTSGKVELISALSH